MWKLVNIETHTISFGRIKLFECRIFYFLENVIHEQINIRTPEPESEEK